MFKSDSLFVAGVFSGTLSGPGSPSHRARVPSPMVATPQVSGGSPLLPVAFGLDLRGAVFLERYGTADGCVGLEVRSFVHQVRADVAVVELNVTVCAASPSGAVEAQLVPAPSAPSQDVDLAEVPVPSLGAAVVALLGNTTDPEAPEVSPVLVAMITSASASVVCAPGGSCAARLVTALCTSSAGSGRDPLQDAASAWAAANATGGALLDEHRQAWAQLWGSGGFHVGPGRLELAQAVNASYYALLSSLRADLPFSISPGGLSTDAYNGHTFWDAELFVQLPLAVFFPGLVEAMIQYRVDRIAGAEAKARSYANDSWAGAMFPWESAVTGLEATPTWAPTGLREQHISGDVVVAARNFFGLTRDVGWLNRSGLPLVDGVARFWSSRAEPDDDGSFHISSVIPPDEYHDFVTDSAYTNEVAALSLQFCAEVHAVLGLDPPPAQFSEVLAGLVRPFNESAQLHPEFAGYAGDEIKQADVVLMGYPLLANMSAAVRLSDLDYYSSRTDPMGPAMTWGMTAVGYLEVGRADLGHAYFNRSYQDFVTGPFLVWREVAGGGGAQNFVTGAGGFLQGAISGFAGLRVRSSGLEFAPQPIAGVPGYRLHGLRFAGRSVDIEVDSDNNSVLVSAWAGSAPGVSLVTPDSSPVPIPLVPGDVPVIVELGTPFLLVLASSE